MSALPAIRWRFPFRGREVFAAVMTLAGLWPIAAAAQGTCTVNRATFRASANCASTSSASFVNIPQTQLDFTVGGAAETCVIVVFSAQTQTAADENMGVRAFITGLGSGEPADTFLGAGTGAVEARSTQFMFENVSPGDYSLRMQYRSGLAGSSVTICEPTVVIHHR
jgi:hypothetical protein